MENVFDTLCSALSESQVKKLFLDDEGGVFVIDTSALQKSLTDESSPQSSSWS